MNQPIIGSDGFTAYMPGTKAMVVRAESTQLFKTDIDPIKLDPTEKYPPMVPWGEENNLPALLEQKVSANAFMSPNMLFNILTGYGDGIQPVKRVVKNDTISFVPYEGNDEVDRFFEENNLQSYLLEQLTDINFFYNVFPEVIFNRENGAKRKIVSISSKEAMFSRLSEMVKEGKDRGRIAWHYYYAKWGEEQPVWDEVIKTPVLDRVSPVRHLREIMKEDEGKAVGLRRNRFIVPVSLPSPGRPYYAKPYWYAIIESGLYDFAQKIMPFKNAMMDNQASIKYVVELGPNYFEEIFRRERITDDKKKEARIKKEYSDIDKFLKGVKNTNKSIITHQKLDPKGQPYPMIKITPIDNKPVGGELIGDNEEVANMMAYGQLVHPSLIGAAPGKNKTINGTEARELFILKQAQLKPLRDLLLMPFYLIKSINGWPKDLYFTIPNIQLTTLDKNKTGQETVMS